MTTTSKIPIGIFGDHGLCDGGLAPSSVFIKRRLLTDWSHEFRLVDMRFVAAVAARGQEKWKHVIDQPPYTGVPMVEAIFGKGVCVRDSARYKNLAWRVRTYVDPIGPIERAKLTDFLIDQLGKPYDWPQIVFGFIGLKPQRENGSGKRWFCSELGAAGDRAADRVVITEMPPSLVPPHLFAVTSGLRTIDWHKRRPEGWGT